MPILKPRRRMVYFRVSEEEFQQLNELCRKQGARSMSDLARDAMQDVLRRTNTSVEDIVVGKLEQLDQTLVQLKQRLDQFGPPLKVNRNGRATQYKSVEK
jgi:hypothetical protein